MLKPTKTTVRIPDVSYSNIEPYIEIAIGNSIHIMTLYEAQHLANQIRKALSTQLHLPNLKNSNL